MVPTNQSLRVVGGPGNVPREGQNRVVGCIGPFFVAPHAFLRQEVWIGPAETGRAVFIVDVQNQLVFGGFADGIVQPFIQFLKIGLRFPNQRIARQNATLSPDLGEISVASG